MKKKLLKDDVASGTMCSNCHMSTFNLREKEEEMETFQPEL